MEESLYVHSCIAPSQNVHDLFTFSFSPIIILCVRLCFLILVPLFVFGVIFCDCLHLAFFRQSWDRDIAQPVFSVQEESRTAFQCLTLSPSGKHLAAGCDDMTIKVYRMSSFPLRRGGTGTDKAGTSRCTEFLFCLTSSMFLLSSFLFLCLFCFSCHRVGYILHGVGFKFCRPHWPGERCRVDSRWKADN